MSEREGELNEWIKTNPLRAWRLANGHTAATVAGDLESTPNSMKNWERGQVRPSPVKMAAIAALIGEKQIDLEGKWDDWLAQRP